MLPLNVVLVPCTVPRAAMSRPSSLSIVPLPQHFFPGLALTQRDFRFNFVINNGSRGRFVTIYTASQLDDQLDEVGR